MNRGDNQADLAGAALPEPARVAAGPEGDSDVDTVVVEEIFLEGDGMTMLRHEAGSTQAIDLLASADMATPAPLAPKRP